MFDCSKVLFCLLQIKEFDISQNQNSKFRFLLCLFQGVGLSCPESVNLKSSHPPILLVVKFPAFHINYSIVIKER